MNYYLNCTTPYETVTLKIKADNPEKAKGIALTKYKNVTKVNSISETRSKSITDSVFNHFGCSSVYC